MELCNIYKLAGGLNIEGGFPCMDLHKTNPSGAWVNLVLVLDRPLVDKILFDDIFENNTYPFLENAIDNLNEHNFLAAYIMIIGFYIKNGPKIFGCENRTFKIVVHIHQDKKSMPLVEYLKYLIDTMVNYLNIATQNIEIVYQTDDKTYVNSEHNYYDTDLLISLSQCAGLDPKLEPGALIIPDYFVPYDIDLSTIELYKKYKTENDLPTRLDDIIKSDYNKFAVNFINSIWTSPNKIKKFCASEFVTSDFNFTNLLQVNKLWNPTNDQEIVRIE